jgi:hypothetical protein
MKKLWLLLLMVIPLQLIHAQQVKHAPTIEQCRDDQRVWMSKLVPLSASVAKVSYKELEGWYQEMGECGSVDPDHGPNYDHTMNDILVTRVTRLEAFLHRQNLWNQFLAEGAPAKR